MKLVIYTQFMENYGAHEWDGKGQCPQYWKVKGGSAYVVENLSPKQVQAALDSGCPTLCGLLKVDNDFIREWVISIISLDDDETVGDSWETPITLSYVDGKWTAKEVIINDEFSCLRKEIAMATRTWTLVPGNHADFKTVYTLVDGRVTETLDCLDPMFSNQF